MSELSKGWITTTLGEIIEEYQAGFASGKKDIEDGLKHLRMNNISIDGKLNLELLRTVPITLAGKQHFLQNGDILICTTNSAKLVGKSAIFSLEGNFSFSNHLTRLRINGELVNTNFIQKYLFYFWKKEGFSSLCKHWVNQSTIPKEKLLFIQVPLAPINEQRRIVAKLEKLLAKVDTCKERLDKTPAILKRFRQSVLSAACSGRLTADWRRQDNEDFLDYDFPPSWKKWELNDVVEGLKQGWSPKCEIFPSSSDDIWGVIKTTAVQSLRFVEEENKQLPSHLKPRPELEVHKGDLLITRAGPRVRAGVTCLVSSVRPRLMACDKVYRFRAKESYVIPLYLAYFLNSSSTISSIDELKTGISDSGVNLTQEKFLALPFWCPPLAEQQEIVRRVETLFKTADRIEQRYQKARTYIDQLTQSILAKAFRGELVPQDPNDEPASVLLERIRAERENRENVAKTAKKPAANKKQRSKKAQPQLEPTPQLEPIQLELPLFD